MHLSQLTDSPRDLIIEGITADSRQVRPGYLFAALPGSKVQGSSYIRDAIQNGAAVILCGHEILPQEYPCEALFLQVENPRMELSRIAALYYPKQPDVIAAVTGTSGKTSVVSFVQQLWTLYGIPQSASLGTLGVRGSGMVRSGSLTTPDTVSLHAALADMAAAGFSHIAMEASSHGLDQYRLHHVNITAAGYTNLSRDHLDYHPNMEHYFQSKARLFTEVLKRNGIAVLNADDEYYPRLSAKCMKYGHRVYSYGKSGEHIRILERTLVPHGQLLKLFVLGHIFDLTLPLVGAFQAMNALCALGLVLAGDGDVESVTPLLERLKGVEGRLEQIHGHPRDAAVYVDYAHKPGAIEAVLNALRPHTQGRLFCLFGCGGNRDAGKRPIMGRIAAGLADVVVVTDDNPRHENPADIRAEILEGAPDAHEISDRREAIAWAIENLEDGDVLVIAGKGHEKGQIIGDSILPFDDVEEAMLAIQKLQQRESR